MVDFINKIGIFGEDGGSNAKEKSERGSKDWGETENELKKKPGKDQPGSSVMNQSLFKME